MALWRDGVAVAAVERDFQPEPDLRGPDVGDLPVLCTSASAQSVPAGMLAMCLPATATPTPAATVRVLGLPVCATPTTAAATTSRRMLERRVFQQSESDARAVAHSL